MHNNVWFIQVEYYLYMELTLKQKKAKWKPKLTKDSIKLIVSDGVTNQMLIHKIEERLKQLEKGKISTRLRITQPKIIKKKRLGSEHLSLEDRTKKFLNMLPKNRL
jgi:CTP synthase (UTP-ammonia lyase)